MLLPRRAAASVVLLVLFASSTLARAAPRWREVPRSPAPPAPTASGFVEHTGARIYYAEQSPPIDFNQSQDPSFSDFAYFSFGLGMAYQVSDTALLSSGVRRVVLGHTMLAYLYGTVVIAAAINLVAGLRGA